MDENLVARALGRYRYPLLLLAVLISLLFFVPFLVVLATSWTSGGFVSFPPEGFSLQWYARVLTDPKWIDSFFLSLWTAAVATAIATVLGTAGAIGVTRVRSRLARRWIRTLFIVPIALPPIAYAVGLYGINVEVNALRGTFVSLIVGQSLIAIPYVFVLVSGGLSRIDPALRPAASTLGAGWVLVLRKIELPALAPYIASGALFAFVLVIDEVVLSVFLLPPGDATLPLQMLRSAQEAISPELSAASTMFSIMALLVLAFVPIITSARARRQRIRAAAPETEGRVP